MSTISESRPLSIELIEQVSGMARAHYRPENPLPYHNYDDHVVRAKGYFEQIVNGLNEKDVEIDVLAGIVALDYHDAGFYVPVSEHGFPTKEAYSADIAAKDLESLHIVADEIEIVYNAILATQFNVLPKTNTEKAVRLADVGNVFADEEEFFRNFVLLLREAHELGQPIAETIDDHARRTTGFLETYIMPAPKFTARDGSEIEFDITAGQRNLRAISRMSLARIVAQLPSKKILPITWFQGNN